MSAAVLDCHILTVGDLLNGGSGKVLLLTGVSWAEYEEFVRHNLDKNNLSFAYADGVLEIMSKTPKHEDYSRFIAKLVLFYCDEFDLTLEDRGSTTYKRTELEKGVEPDECFYVQSASKIIGLQETDLEKYPVPDAAVEIDLTTKSLNKFPIYAALGVPELWIYDGKKIRFYQLAEKKYNQSETSLTFPLLSSDVLTEFLNRKETEGQTAALKAFREWLRHKSNS